MPGRILFSLTVLGLSLFLLACCSAETAVVPSALAAPNVFSGPANGGCYLDTVTTCRIQVDRWQPIVTDPGQKLLAFQLRAVPGGSGTGSVLYDFRTDVSNPPVGSYLPSLVKKGFAAQCGATYSLSLRARDAGDLDFEEIGRTNTFQCPAAVVVEPSPTPGVTVTPTGTPSPTWQLYLPAILGS
jgi:hypothetical protein